MNIYDFQTEKCTAVRHLFTTSEMYISPSQSSEAVKMKSLVSGSQVNAGQWSGLW